MADDFSALSSMIYSGRGITLGLTPDENPFVGYTLTGRSPSSQARRLVYDEQFQVIRTAVTDEEQLKKGSPSLLLYPALVHANGKIIASNGAQTNLIHTQVRNHPQMSAQATLERALEKPSFEYDPKLGWIDITSYEPDSPNFTPRISAFLDSNEGCFHIASKSINKKVVTLDPLSLDKGLARTVTTYHGGNESPLKSFSINPLKMRVSSDNPEGIAESLYEAIGPKWEYNFRVAAAVMMRRRNDLEVAIINRSERGS